MALMLRQWSRLQSEAQMKAVHQRILEGCSEEEEDDEEKKKKQEWNEEEVQKTAAEGEAILQGVLDLASRHHLIRRNDLTIACFMSARRASGVSVCKPIEPGDLVECVFSRRRSGDLRRVRFQYASPIHHTHSPMYTLNTVWMDFLSAVSWVSVYVSWVQQYVRQQWKGSNDVYHDLNDDIALKEKMHLTQLQHALLYLQETLDKHSTPTPTPPTAPSSSSKKRRRTTTTPAP